MTSELEPLSEDVNNGSERLLILSIIGLMPYVQTADVSEILLGILLNN